MKTKKQLDVDFIGGAQPLTKEEEKRISEAIKKLKAKRIATKPTKKSTLKKKESVR